MSSLLIICINNFIFIIIHAYAICIELSLAKNEFIQINNIFLRKGNELQLKLTII